MKQLFTVHMDEAAWRTKQLIILYQALVTARKKKKKDSSLEPKLISDSSLISPFETN